MSKNLQVELKNIFLKLEGNEIFKNFSLRFSSKGISIILGPNGSGKTILTKIMKGIVNINKGKVLIKKKKRYWVCSTTGSFFEKKRF